ncbi:HNH endonuclease [Paenibacillus tundrae]|uniref:HNH endonuclease n=1 Tax=Paenibacillus tundrae TaxID=528187 RepID=UPI0039B461ED
MEMGSAPFRQEMTEHEAQLTKTCMYCGQKRPLSEFRRRTGKRAGPGARRGACRHCRQLGGQADNDNTSIRPTDEAVKSHKGAAAARPSASASHTAERIVDAANGTPSIASTSQRREESQPSIGSSSSMEGETADFVASSTASSPSGNRKKRRRRRKAKRPELQSGNEQTEPLSRTEVERETVDQPQTGADLQDRASQTHTANADPSAKRARARIAAGTDQAAEQEIAAAKALLPAKPQGPAAAAQPAAAAKPMPGQAPGTAMEAAPPAPVRQPGSPGSKPRPARKERAPKAGGEDAARAGSSGQRAPVHSSRSHGAGTESRPRRHTPAVPVAIDPEDPSSLRTNRQGMVRMRGKTDKGRRWHQEVDMELAVTLVKEKAAVVVNRYTIRRLFSNKDFKRFILTRDNYTCYFCGSYGDTIDHLLPRAKGGHTTPLNCVCACNLCNQSKAAMDAEEFMRSGIPEWNAAHQEELNELAMQEAQLE